MPRLATGSEPSRCADTSAIAASTSSGKRGAHASGRGQTRVPAAGSTRAACDVRYSRTASRPSPSVAVDAFTVTPGSSRASASRSIETPRCPRFVQHVEVEAEGDAQLGDLQGQQERADQVLRVAHLHHGVVPGREQDVARDRLVFAHRDEVVRARGVDDFPELIAESSAPSGDLDRGSRVVADRDVGAGEGAEDDALSDVRLTHEKRVTARLRLVFDHARTDPCTGGTTSADAPGSEPEVESHIRRNNNEAKPPIVQARGARRTRFGSG